MNPETDSAPAREAEAATVPDLSIVVPMYNEEAVIDAFFECMREELTKTGLTWEIVCINDGSRDRTIEILKAEAAKSSDIVAIDLARNFGKELALTAGLSVTRGRAVIPIDADLEEPPELIHEFIRLWNEGYDVVYGIRASRDEDSAVKRFTSFLFYQLYNRIVDVPIPQATGDFRLMDRQVVNALKAFPERNRFNKGLFTWVGFKQIGVPFPRGKRFAGVTKWNYWKLWTLALDGLTGFSTAPLRVWSYLGGAISALAMLYGAFLVLRTLVIGVDVPGYASLMVVMLVLGGVQIMSLGIIGEYLGRLFTEVKGRPQFLIREIYSQDDRAGRPWA